jgi:hypothetical protein
MGGSFADLCFYTYQPLANRSFPEISPGTICTALFIESSSLLYYLAGNGGAIDQGYLFMEEIKYYIPFFKVALFGW